MSETYLFLILFILLGMSKINSKKALKFLNNFNTPLDYDMYVLTVQWGGKIWLKLKNLIPQGTVCISDPKHCHEKIYSIPKNILTLHGLWPSYQNSKRIDKCNTGTEVLIKKDSSDLFQMMQIYWLSFTKTNEDFWSHEYNTHGFCYTEKFKFDDFKPFFEFTMTLFNDHQMDQILLKALGEQSGLKEFTVRDLKNHIKGVVGDLIFELDCKRFYSKQYLQEIRFLFDLNLNPIQIPYPTDCKVDEPIFIDFQ